MIERRPVVTTVWQKEATSCEFGNEHVALRVLAVSGDAQSNNLPTETDRIMRNKRIGTFRYLILDV